MSESLSTRLMRWGFNFFPAYRGTGGRITYIAADWREVRIRLPLSWRTRNYVGTIYGGSIYGAVDPFYMIMLIKLLGPAYVVWDKAATVRFQKPGTRSLYARFSLPTHETDFIRTALRTVPKLDRTYTIELTDQTGVVHATIQKTIQIRHKGSPTIPIAEISPT